MPASDFQLREFFFALDRWGIVDVMLPFLLFFVVLFAILQKTKILGENKKNINSVIALVVSLIIVVQHVTGRLPVYADPVIILNNALPQVSLVIVAVVFLLILIGVFGQDYVFLGVTMPGWITLISLITIVLIFGGAAGWWWGNFGITLQGFFGTEGVAVFIMLVMFGLIIAWITGDSKEREDRALMNRLGMDFSKLFGKRE